MNIDRRLSTIEPSIDQSGSAAITPNNQPPRQVQLIENAINPVNFAQENDDEPINLNALLPNIDDHMTLLNLNGPVNSDGLVPDINDYTELVT
jgi:hypothetical protein